MLNLVGTGLPPPLPLFDVSDVNGAVLSDPLNFGSTVIGDSIEYTIRLSNYGEGVLLLNAGSITGDFRCDSLPPSIAAGSHANVTLTFAPTDTGVRSGLFGFHHNASDSVFTLNLTGIGRQASFIVDPSASIVSQYALSNYPNPFNATTHITYSIAKPGKVKITICDLLGRIVATLIDESQEAGSKQISWNAFDQPSGIYFLRLTTSEFTSKRKIILAK